MYGWITVLVLTPINAFLWYWHGHKDGFREGYTVGRNIVRFTNERK